MKLLRITIAAIVVLAAASTPVLAEGPAWTFRFQGAFADSSVGTQMSLDDGIASSVDIGSGFGIGAEYRLSDRIGIEFTALLAGLDISSSISSGELVQHLELGMMPFALGVPFHFDMGGRADLYVGPTFGIVRYLDLEWYVGGDGVNAGVGVDTDTAFGAAVGLDVPLGQGRWAFSGGLRYMKTSAAETDVDPLIALVGFAVRF